MCLCTKKTASESECSSSETETSQEAWSDNEKEGDEAHTSEQSRVLESSHDHDVSGDIEASEAEDSVPPPVPDIPLPLQGMQRNRRRSFSLVDAFSDRRPSLRRCGATCSHSAQESSHSSAQRNSIEERAATSTQDGGSKQPNSPNPGTSKETRFPSIELMLGQVRLDSVMRKAENLASQNKESKPTSANLSAADLLQLHANEQRNKDSSSAACESGGKPSKPTKLFTQNCEVTMSPHMQRKYEFDLWLEVAKQLRQNSFRASPAAAKDPSNLSSRPRLPAVSCEIQGCEWKRAATDMIQEDLDHKEDHPWDASLRLHVEEAHTDLITDIVKVVFSEIPREQRVWDVYKAASCL